MVGSRVGVVVFVVGLACACQPKPAPVVPVADREPEREQPADDVGLDSPAASPVAPPAVIVEQEPTAASPAPAPAGTMQIGEYQFELPPWWDAVEVAIPEGIDAGNAAGYVADVYGNDDGSAETWREALKVWALVQERAQGFPVYIAHCYRRGGQHADAARVYADLHALADTQADNEDWYHCYLAYNAGKAYAEVGDLDQARHYLEIAVTHLPDSDSAIHYYASQANTLLAELR